ncbi:hypothetical protein FIA58_010020 [Flavobacterium jejuense]|uniref:Uncharacterized protein n=1 Tax=Flavobacterium jejuense TaxID=1544455 RepID=A0ABX0IW61_9FLAO|nr:hypothetical protein [Flavobacterium jejuense]
MFFGKVYINEGGNLANIASFKIGYYYWLTSFGMLAIASFINFYYYKE